MERDGALVPFENSLPLLDLRRKALIQRLVKAGIWESQ